MLKLMQRIAAVPQIISAFAALRADVVAVLKDTRVRGAVDRFREDPAVAPIMPRISAEWRAVEDAVNRLK